MVVIWLRGKVDDLWSRHSMKRWLILRHQNSWSINRMCDVVCCNCQWPNGRIKTTKITCHQNRFGQLDRCRSGPEKRVKKNRSVLERAQRPVRSRFASVGLAGRVLLLLDDRYWSSDSVLSRRSHFDYGAPSLKSSSVVSFDKVHEHQGHSADTFHLLRFVLAHNIRMIDRLVHHNSIQSASWSSFLYGLFFFFFSILTSSLSWLGPFSRPERYNGSRLYILSWFVPRHLLLLTVYHLNW